MNRKIKKISFVLLGFIFIFAFQAPLIINAQTVNKDYELLTPLPDGRTTVNAGDPIGYIQSLYQLFISLSIVLAVFMVVYGGIIYMSTDAIEGKKDGKAIIQRSLWGLLLVLISGLLLSTINPEILDLGNFLRSKDITITTPPVPVPGVNTVTDSKVYYRILYTFRDSQGNIQEVMRWNDNEQDCLTDLNKNIRPDPALRVTESCGRHTRE